MLLVRDDSGRIGCLSRISRRLLLLNVAECLRDLLRVMQLETVLEIFYSEQEAIRSVSSETPV